PPEDIGEAVVLAAIRDTDADLILPSLHCQRIPVVRADAEPAIRGQPVLKGDIPRPIPVGIDQRGAGDIVAADIDGQPVVEKLEREADLSFRGPEVLELSVVANDIPGGKGQIQAHDKVNAGQDLAFRYDIPQQPAEVGGQRGGNELAKGIVD